MTPDDRDAAGIDRREFVRRSSLGAVGAGLVAQGIARRLAQPAVAQKPPAPKLARRKLGRTGLEVSEVGFGAFGFSNGDLLVAAIGAGMNLIDTSPDYQEGAAERAIGSVMPEHRKDVILMTKWSVDPGTTKQQLLDSLNGSLERLQTDKVEIIHVGMVESGDTLKTPAIFEAFDQAKAAGKVSFLGVSSHSGQRAEICRAAVKDGRFDMLCVKHSFPEAGLLKAVLDEAHAKDMGVVVFKVKAGARPEDVAGFAPGKSFDLAAAKWALQSEAVQSVCVGISKYEEIKLYASAIGLPLDEDERRGLDAFGERFRASYCRYCGTCEGACPQGVAIADIMRFRMYAESYRMLGEASRLYAKLPAERTAAACLTCMGHCLGACPKGLRTRERLLEAHQMLS
jgi:predicted aldo/keto reductase-like oxidoreductase